MYWWTSDTHFSHGNILKYANRTIFMNKHEKEVMKNGTVKEQNELRISDETLERHDEALIRNWNERVKPSDTVYFLGDWCFRNSSGGKQGEGTTTRAEYYLNQLNGNIVCIKGNHDGNNGLKTILTEGVIYIANKRIRMIHNPQFVNSDYKLHFTAHVHHHWRFKRIKTMFGFTDCVNVGTDVWNYRPVDINEIFKHYYRWKNSLKIEEDFLK